MLGHNRSMSLRVMTYNVLDGGRGREELILEVLRTASPSVIVLQEVFDEEFMRLLSRALGMYHFVAHANSKYHLGLLSSWPIVASDAYRPFPPFQQALLEATIDHPAGPLHVFGVQLVPRPLVLLELWRWWEIRLVLSRVAGRAGSACLLVGDFNACAPGDSPEIRKLGFLSRLMILIQGQRIYRFAIRAVLRAGMIDCFRSLHPDSDGSTYGPPTPFGRIDYVFASPGMRAALTSCSVVREPPAVDRASDHYPVIADFAV